MSVRLSAPAKINLGLHVLRRRGDGYHDIETVFMRIGWRDAVTAAPAAALRLTCTDASLPTDHRNLVMKAARALAAHAGVDQGAALHLEKRIPHGAGLGGGSSDAATTLRALDALWQTRLPADDLHRLAAGLGSDVPFFLDDAPAAFGSGRGERLEPLRDAAGIHWRCPFHLAVVMPAVAVATADAYRWIVPNDAGRPDLRTLVAENDVDRWRLDLVNDFETPVFERYPELRAIRDGLRAMGAGYAAMSGSGAALFGVFRDAETAQQAALTWKGEGRRVWSGPADERQAP